MRCFFRRIAIVIALAAWGLAGAVAAASAVVTTPQVRAELVAHAPGGVRGGRTLQLGLKIEHQPHWHTYWKNPGDSGLPTTLAFSLPDGFVAGEIEWPTPSPLPAGPLMNFGYGATVLLPVTVQVPAGFDADVVQVKLRADWLVCNDVCIPEGGDFALSLPARTAAVANAALFDTARQARPATAPGVRATAEPKGSVLHVRVVGLPAGWNGKALRFFPETAGVLANAAPAEGAWQGGIWQAALAIDTQRSAAPAVLPAVLSASGQTAGVQVHVEVTSPWPALAQAAGPPGASPGPASAEAEALGLGAAVLLAMVGGALLNLMPCVFPVLSLKVLGFARHARQRRALLAGGLAYTAGVVVSFVALAAALLVLRAGGEQLGWGFQLQSPGVVAGLAILFTLIGLNLAGVFELGGVLPGSWLAARARHPLVDALLTGFLAVAVAAPCTAPFMGASLGVALTLPAAQAFGVFGALGLGMALPYLGASAWPAAARLLPRPGPWMAHFEVLMAFPMFATVVWLVWVLGQQAGIDGAAALLAVLVATAFAAWALGAPALGRRARRALGGAALLVLAATLGWVAPLLHPQSAAQPRALATADHRWQAWSTERVASAQAEGRAVFVDFTAAWCVTCQFNKRHALSHPDVLAAFEAKRVLLLRADWTRRDSAISAELTRLHRSGVPVYALYAPGGAAAPAPRLLTEILSVAEVLEAVSTLPG